MPTKVLIVDDYADFRKIVNRHLLSQGLDVVITEAASGEEGVRMALKEKPDIVLMDIRLPQINGIDAATLIKHRVPKCKIIILTMFETEAFKKVFKSDNIIAYIGKSELYDKLVPVIKKHCSKEHA